MKASQLIKQYSLLQIAQRLTLAKKYPDNARPADFLIQPKLDGIRAFYVPTIGFVSRDGIRMPAGRLTHIQIPDSYDIIVDGELYCHRMPLGDINSRVAFKSRTPHEDEGCISFHAFDVMHFEKSLIHRLEIVNEIVHQSQHVNPVITHRGKSLDDLEQHHAYHIEGGYEGSMIKANVNGYIQGRCKNVLKYKHWLFAKAICIGWNPGAAGKKYEATTGSLKFQSSFDPKITWDITGMTDDARSSEPATFIGRTALIRFSRRTDTGQIMHATIREWTN